MRKRAISAAAIVMVAAFGVGAGPVSAVPSTKLPAFTLYCGSSTVRPADSVIVPSDSLWIRSGELAGHYVILSEEHYLERGLLDAPPQSYDGLPVALPPKVFGKKAGLSGSAIQCDFVSQWPGETPEEDISVVGPITIARVPR